MSDQQIVFKVVLDDSGVPASAHRAADGIQRVGKAAQDSSGAMLQFGKNGEVTGRQLQALSYQTSDIVTQLAGGQNPLLILLQQGGQLRDQFGGVGNVFRALGQVMTVARVATLGLVGAVVGLGWAAFKGYEESARLTRQLALSGEAAGRTRGQLDGMAAQITASTGTPISDARGALYGLAASGAFVGETLPAAGRALVSLQKLSGQSTDEIVKDFAGMRDGVAQWAVAHNRAYNFLSADQYVYIRGLEAQGRVQEAAKVTLEALAGTMETRVGPAMGWLARQVEEHNRLWSEFGNWAMNAGRPDTPEEQIRKVREELEGLDAYLRKIGVAKPLEARLLSLTTEQFRTSERADDRRRTQEEENEKILLASKGYQDALLGLEQAGQSQRLAQQIRAAQNQRLQADAAYRQRNISAQQYTEAIIATERSKVAAEEAAARKEIDIASRRVVEKPQDVLARQQAVIAANTKLEAVLAKRDQLNARIRADEFRVGPDAGTTTPREQFRSAELAGDAYRQTQDFLIQRNQASRQAAADLVLVNRAMSLQLIDDERARGLAEIDNDEALLRRRVDLAFLSAEERRAVEDDLAQWRLAREQQLQRDLETAAQRRQRELLGPRQQRDFTEGFVDAGRQGFRDWLVDGKSATDVLVRYIRDKMIDIFATRFLDKPLQQAGDLVFKGIAALFTGGLFHQGGVVGMGGMARQMSPLAFAGARRYHSGGLAGDEVPAILQRGEEVLRRNDPRHVLNGGGASPAPATVVQLGGNTYHFGSEVTRTELARYVDARDRQQAQQLRRVMRESRR